MSLSDPKSKVLLQLDPDEHASVFDSVVAIDSGVDHLLRHHSVKESDVEDLVHGAIFTRGLEDLKRTAIFVGGSNVEVGERILKKVISTFFGPLSVSVMLDSNGANTTAAAAVLSATRHRDLQGAKVVVLGGTGPVGRRICVLAARQGANVMLGSRSQSRSANAVDTIKLLDSNWNLTPFATGDDAWLDEIKDADILISAGAAGVELISKSQLEKFSQLRVAIDLNAVPPAGIEGVDVMATGSNVNELVVYGAIGVGGLKMKIHKAALRKLFTQNNQVLDANEIYDIGTSIVSK